LGYLGGAINIKPIT